MRQSKEDCLKRFYPTQNGETDFKMQSKKILKKSYLESQLPRFNLQIFRNSALDLCYLRFCIQESLALIYLRDSKLNPRQSTHNDNPNRLLTPLFLSKSQ